MDSKISDQSLDLTCIGRIADAHGIKGLVKIKFIDFDPTLLADAPSIYTNEDGGEILAVTIKNSNGKHYLASIDGVTDRNDAEALKGTELYIDSELVPHDETQDLIGLSVLNEQKETIGTEVAFENFGASDLLEIKPEIGDSYYIPFTDDYILDLNQDDETITITPFEMG